MKKNPVVHFEMPAEDKKRMSNFYTKVFGWETNQLGSDMSDYVVVTTTESDKKTGRPNTSGAINGGFYQKMGPTDGPSIVIAVENIHESMEKIKKEGGEILHGPDKIPGVGEYASFRDTEGNRVSILQPLQM